MGGRGGALWLPVLALLGGGQPAAQDVSREIVRKALQRIFPAAEVIEPVLVVPTAAQREEIARRTGARRAPRVIRYYVARRGGTIRGYGVVRNVRGRSRDITYLLAVGPDLVVRAVEILVYRESHGHEVRRKAWRAQFVGKSLRDPLRVGQDIVNIAGATISCRAVTAGVRRNLQVLAVLIPASRKLAERRERATPATPGRSAGARRERAPAAETGSNGHPLGAIVRRSRVLMGTPLAITVHGATEAEAHAAVEAAWAEVARLERVLSDYRDDSELSRLNAAAGRGPQPVSEDLFAFAKLGCRLARETEGALDIGAGALFALWREAARRGVWPAPARVETLRNRGGAAKLRLLDGAIELPEGMSLDPGALGKGFALDRAAAVLRARGLRHALLDFGGQLLALGARPDGSPWRVGLRRGRDGAPGSETLSLAGGSLATTADYERGTGLGGRRISHVVDPRTGRPVEGMLSVTVHAADAATADGLSTALFVMGPERGPAWAKRHGLAARFETSAGVLVTPAFEELRDSVESSR